MKPVTFRPGCSITPLQTFPITQLFHFFVRRMLAAPVAELLQFQPVRCRLSVLGSRIVPFFAITALHGNDLSGHKNLLFSGAKAPESPRFPARLKPCPDTNRISLVRTLTVDRPSRPAWRVRNPPLRKLARLRSPRWCLHLPCARLRGWQSASPSPSPPA